MNIIQPLLMVTPPHGIRFPASMEWHPMSYGVCNDSSCIMVQVQRVVEMSPSQTQIIPALAGLWGKRSDNRPDLEEQMQSIRARFPQTRNISIIHFAFSWQEPEFDQERRFCQEIFSGTEQDFSLKFDSLSFDNSVYPHLF